MKTYDECLSEHDGDERAAQIAWLKANDSIPPWIGDYESHRTRASEEQRLGIGRLPTPRVLWICGCHFCSTIARVAREHGDNCIGGPCERFVRADDILVVDIPKGCRPRASDHEADAS